MDDPDPFVTVLRSSNAELVQAVVAALRSEGVPCEHPGLNHAGLLPGFSYVEIQLRVPTSREAEALALIGELGRPNASENHEGATFRVHRTRAVSYSFAGLGVGFVVNLVGSFVGLIPHSGVAFLIFGTAACVGYVVGGRRSADICSRPDCGGALPNGVNGCPKCKTPIRGLITRASDHLSAADDWERSERRAQKRESAG